VIEIMTVRIQPIMAGEAGISKILQVGLEKSRLGLGVTGCAEGLIELEGIAPHMAIHTGET